MQSGSLLSGIFHLALALVVVFGLPSWITPPPEPEPLNTVEVVTLAPKATAPELTKPKVPKPPEPPKPEAKPEPTPTPPPAPPPQPKVEAKPEPKPEPKVEAKPEPKPEPIPEKKAEVKPEKKEEPKKEEPKKPEPKKAEVKKADRFDSVLDSVLKNRAPAKPRQHDPQAKPTQQAAAPQPRQTAPNLSDQLARSEMDAVRDKVRPCWNFPVGAPNPERLIVDIEVSMNPNGTVREATIVDRSRMNDPFYRSAAEAALRAALNPSCQPFPLPPEKYSTWRNFTFGFDPRDL